MGTLTSTILPIANMLLGVAAAASVLFIAIGGYQIMTSSGNPLKLDKGKSTLKHALMGLVIVLTAAFLSHFLVHLYGPVQGHNVQAVVPGLKAIKAGSPGGGLISVILKTISAVLANIVGTIGKPFVSALSYFTKSTPIPSANPDVVKLWVVCAGLSDGLLVLVIMLIGLRVMSAGGLGFSEISLTKILTQIGLSFLGINASLLITDTLIRLSNGMVGVINKTGSAAGVWQSLINVVGSAGKFSLAGLIMMVVFCIFSVILIIYYIGRIVGVYLGAVLAPLIMLMLVLPGFRDFALLAIKKYINLVFVLFVQVIILDLAGGLFFAVSKSNAPLINMLVGIASLVALIKTQGVMGQLSYASVGPRNLRRVSDRVVGGISYLSSHTAGISATKYIYEKSGSSSNGGSK